MDDLWIIFIPIIIAVVIPAIMQGQKKNKTTALIQNVITKRGKEMNGNLIKKYVGKKCEIHTLDQYVEGKVLSLDENWLEVRVETKKEKKTEIVNTNFIEKISIIAEV